MKHTLIVLALCAASTARAEFWDGNELLSRLESRDASDKLLAIGYITGAADALNGATFCPPSGVRVGQIADMVKNTLQALPSQRHKSADRFVNETLAAAWPCKQNNTRGQT